MPYPSTFTNTPTDLAQVELDQAGLAAITKLREAGFMVTAGVRTDDVSEITEISQQSPVREYCPNDLTGRFGSREMMEHWLGKNGGRAVFLLRESATGAIRGYGWTGPAVCKKIPDSKSTFGIRLDERVSGRGLGQPFLAAILSGSAKLFETEGLWGETWGSNVGAVKIYLRSGAVVVVTEDDWRPTLKPTPAEASEGKRRDVRIYIKFPATFVA